MKRAHANVHVEKQYEDYTLHNTYYYHEHIHYILCMVTHTIVYENAHHVPHLYLHQAR